jgi:hypothetical protein
LVDEVDHFLRYNHDIDLRERNSTMGRRGKDLEKTLYQQIDLALTNGETQREIAVRLHCSRVTVAKAAHLRTEAPMKPMHSPLQEKEAVDHFHAGQQVMFEGFVRVIALINSDGTLRLHHRTGLFFRDHVASAQVTALNRT